MRARKSPLSLGIPGNSLLQWWPPSLPMIGQTQTLKFPLFFLEMTSWTVGPHWPIWIKCLLVWVNQTLASPLPLGRNWTLMCPWTLECRITSSSLPRTSQPQGKYSLINCPVTLPAHLASHPWLFLVSLTPPYKRKAFSVLPVRCLRPHGWSILPIAIVLCPPSPCKCHSPFPL